MDIQAAPRFIRMIGRRLRMYSRKSHSESTENQDSYSQYISLSGYCSLLKINWKLKVLITNGTFSCDALKNALPKSMTKFGPASAILDWIDKKDGKKMTMYKVRIKHDIFTIWFCVPIKCDISVSFGSLPTCKHSCHHCQKRSKGNLFCCCFVNVWWAMIMTNWPSFISMNSLSLQFSQLCMDEISLYISYCLVSVDFIVVTVTDNLGARSESAVLNLKPNIDQIGST